MVKPNQWARLALVGLCAAALALCRPATAQTSKNVQKLTLAVASNSVIYGSVWIALAEDLFRRHGVDVDLVTYNALTTGSAMIASGSVDLVATTAFLGLRIAAEGKPLSYIMNLNNMGARVNAMVTRPTIKSVDQLAAMGERCRVLLLPPGSATWAIYQSAAKRFNLHCVTSTAATTPLVVAGVLSGQFDASFINPQDAYAARDAGKANILVDPLKIDDAFARSIYPYEHPLSVIFGLRDNLQNKRDAVTRFIGALREANEHIASLTPEQLGDLTKKLPSVFATTPASALVLQYRIQKSLFPHGPNAGYIPESQWNALLDVAPSLWSVPATSPAVRYTNIVDMNYFNAAK